MFLYVKHTLSNKLAYSSFVVLDKLVVTLFYRLIVNTKENLIV
jgi:hypothetical protein